MNIVLIGFRGVGKSTVGQLLADELGVEFIDTDNVIQQRCGMSISDFFLKKTESVFRLVESDIITELSKLDAKVIATGGGAVLKHKNIKNLKRRGLLFLLDADIATICRRIKADKQTKTSRPKLINDDLYAEVKELLELRTPYYHRAANWVIDTSNKMAKEIKNEIIRILKAQKHLPL